MVMFIHIAVGILTVVLGAGALIGESQAALRAQLVSFIATIGTGFMLVFFQSASLAHLCVSGTLFSAVSLVLFVAARRKLGATTVA